MAAADLTASVSSLSVDSYDKKRLSDITDDSVGSRVSVFGWVTKCTALKSVTFVELTSHLETVKCVLSGSVSLTFSTSLTVQGTVVRVRNPRDRFTVEIHVDHYTIYGGAQAPSFPLNRDSDKDSVLNYAHLALRLPERSLFLIARSRLLSLFRDFYRSHSYVEITPPTIVQTQVEGGSTLFSLDYYGAPAYLTQSSQLYLETVAPVAGRCFCIMPSYRAEQSRTARHLSEYTHVEAELVDIEMPDLLDSIESLIRYVIDHFYSDGMIARINQARADFVPFELGKAPFRRVKYEDAIKFFKTVDHRKPDGTPYEMLDDICDASEKYLVQELGEGQPVFLTYFPIEHKPFYMARDSGRTESCDLLFPGIGEVVGGSMRCDSYDELLAGFKREGISPEPYSWYLDMARFGPSRHGGYGIGFERIMMGLMSYKNVDEATLYPRKVSRCSP